MTVRILTGDCRDVLKTLPAESVDCVVTSPPYWGLRDDGVAGAIGLETSLAEFVSEMVDVFGLVRRVHASYESSDRSGLDDVGRGMWRNKRSVWEVATSPFPDAHFATFPPALIRPCILAGCPTGGVVLDPFGGAGTTGLVADREQRDAILIELNPAYATMARRRIDGDSPLFSSPPEAAAE